jgi:hypothetical protein
MHGVSEAIWQRVGVYSNICNVVLVDCSLILLVQTRTSIHSRTKKTNRNITNTQSQSTPWVNRKYLREVFCLFPIPDPHTSSGIQSMLWACSTARIVI